VLLHYDVVKPGESPKFQKSWRGPYLVTSRSDDGLLYRIRHCATGKEPRAAVHANRLKLYQDDRDCFYLRHNINPQNVTQSAAPDAQPVTSPTVSDTTVDTHAVDRLLRHKHIGNKDYYLVKWLDPKASQTWEPSENITQFAIDQFYVQRRAKSKG